jgi:uncharacterized RDD family membrane protein YckC
MPTADARFCTECGKPASAEDLFQFEGRSVCPECKPAFAQRLRQEGIAPTALRGLDYGGFWIRLVARIIDGIILGVAVLATNALIMILFRESAGSRTSIRVMGPLVTALTFAANIGLAALYEGYFLVRNAATPGKMVLSLKVINVNGAPITWGKAIARFLCYYLDNLTLMIGYIIAAFDAEKRALHDHICGTRVIRQGATQTILSTRV